MKVSVLFFSADGTASTDDKYRLLMDTVRLIDGSAIEAVWLPERHFTHFGGLYPNPAVVGAAVAAVTSSVRIRAGSVILPLHDPLRIAEEWSVVDNMSAGRVEISFGSGWNVNDFVLAPDRYEQRRAITREGIDVVRRLWRGESVRRVNGCGTDTDIRILPRPCQPELPVWITAQSEGTFVDAGRSGYPVLTNLNFTTPDTLARRCETYREHARGERARMAVMVHTYVGADSGSAVQEATPALHEYLSANLDMRAEFAAGKGGAAAGPAAGQRTAILDRGVDRILGWSGLIGGHREVVERIGDLAAAGVDEVACLVDFGVEPELTLSAVRRLCAVAEAVG